MRSSSSRALDLCGCWLLLDDSGDGCAVFPRVGEDAVASMSICRACIYIREKRVYKIDWAEPRDRRGGWCLRWWISRDWLTLFASLWILYTQMRAYCRDLFYSYYNNRSQAFILWYIFPVRETLYVFQDKKWTSPLRRAMINKKLDGQTGRAKWKGCKHFSSRRRRRRNMRGAGEAV